MAFSPLLTELIDALRCLPGVGPRSAQRMALHLLERNRQGGEHLARTLERALALIQHCKHCRTFCEVDRCLLCNDTSRDAGLLCVVETPADILAIEHTLSFRGYYFVLMGRLSPLDGIGPEELGLPLLIKRLDSEPLREVILATNPTVEGEVTAHYISNLVRMRSIKATRIAHGVPLGGELEYVDGGTLAHALAGRIAIED